MAKKKTASATGLSFRKLADKSRGERLEWKDRDGNKHLINPENGKREPWPLIGVLIEGEKPARCEISMAFVDKAVSEGWMTRVGERVVTAPGGPPRNPNAKTHVFHQCDEIIIHAVELCGLEPVKVDVRYKVLRNPAKVPCAPGAACLRLPEKHRPPHGNAKSGKTPFDVVWTYEIELVGVEPRKIVT